ncbi:hypothetical protein FGB62_276g00 [Gracilaria domingensis]|nr:hypothetical protein FGB62_276g00 [Gracilaria domingensis]
MAAVRRVAAAHRGQTLAASLVERGRSAEHLGSWCGACGRRATALDLHGEFVGVRTAVGCRAGSAGMGWTRCAAERQPGHVGRAALRVDQGARVSGQRAGLLPAAGAPAARHRREESALDGDLCALGADLPSDGQRRAQPAFWCCALATRRTRYVSVQLDSGLFNDDPSLWPVGWSQTVQYGVDDDEGYDSEEQKRKDGNDDENEGDDE